MNGIYLYFVNKHLSSWSLLGLSTFGEKCLKPLFTTFSFYKKTLNFQCILTCLTFCRKENSGPPIKNTERKKKKLKMEDCYVKGLCKLLAFFSLSTIKARGSFLSFNLNIPFPDKAWFLSVFRASL